MAMPGFRPGIPACGTRVIFRADPDRASKALNRRGRDQRAPVDGGLELLLLGIVVAAAAYGSGAIVASVIAATP